MLSFSLLQVYLLESLQPTLKTLNLEATGRGTRDIEYYNLGAGVFAGIVDRKRLKAATVSVTVRSLRVKLV